MSFFDISWDKKHNKMESHDKKQGRFPQTFKKYAYPVLNNLWAYSREVYLHRYFPDNQE